MPSRIVSFRELVGLVNENRASSCFEYLVQYFVNAGTPSVGRDQPGCFHKLGSWEYIYRSKELGI